MSGIEGMSSEEVENLVISCIGVDNIIHVCLPWEDKCYCGIPVKRKRVVDNDRLTLLNCWECTY